MNCARRYLFAAGLLAWIPGSTGAAAPASLAHDLYVCANLSGQSGVMGRSGAPMRSGLYRFTGRQGFEWIPAAGVDPTLADRFRVVARSGATAVDATPLMRDRVDAVSTGDTLTLELRRSGSVPYADIKAFN